MALSVSNNMTAWGTGDTGESIDVLTGAGWYDLDNLHADFGRMSSIISVTADFYEGASGVEGCVGTRVQNAANTAGMVYYDGSTTIDMSGTMFVRATVKYSEVSKMGTKAQGGIQIIIMDSGGDYATWAVGGSDDYSGDWEQYLVDLSSTRYSVSATAPTLTDIIYVGVCSYYPTAPARAENQFIDAQWYGSDPSITVTGTVAVAGEGWSELEGISQAVTARYGPIRLRNGIYELRGGIKFNDTGTSSVDFSDDQNAKLRYVPAPVGSLDSISEILLQGNTTGTTDFELGNLVGGAGLLGGNFFSPSVLYTFDSETNKATIDSCNLYGTIFEGSGVMLMDDTGTTQNVVSCQLIGCKQFDPGAATVSLTSFINTSDVDAALLWNASMSISDSNFIANTVGAGTEFPVIGSYDMDNLQHSGNTYDILNPANAATITAGSFVVTRGYKILTVGTTDYTLIGSADNVIGTKFVATGVGVGTGTATELLVINKTNGSNPATSEDTGTNADELFVGSVSVTITVLDEDTGLPIASTARVTLLKDSDKSELDIAAVNASGIYSYSYAGATPLDITGWVREFSQTGTDYVQKDFSGTIGTNGFSLTVSLTPIT